MKAVFAVIVSFFFLIAATSVASASLVTVDKNGEVILKVLSSEATLTPSASDLTIKDIKTEQGVVTDSQVSLQRDNDKIALSIVSPEGEKSLDVTGLGADLIEIEERPEVKKAKIGIVDGQFAIEQDGITALTNFTISINPETAKIAIHTPSGQRFLSVLPKDAFEGGVRAKSLTKLKEGTRLALVEAGGSELLYEMEGEKTINLFNLMDVDVGVKASISAFTGEVVRLEQPVWLKVLGFVFS